MVREEEEQTFGERLNMPFRVLWTLGSMVFAIGVWGATIEVRAQNDRDHIAQMKEYVTETLREINSKLDRIETIDRRLVRIETILHKNLEDSER